jgi:hypothetical protein
MIQKIETIEDVKTFFAELMGEDLNFHPDNDFKDYINLHTDEPTYTEEEAELRNELVGQCFMVCEYGEVDFYELCMDILPPDFHKHIHTDE